MSSADDAMAFAEDSKFRKVHNPALSQVCRQYGVTPDDAYLVVCENRKVVYVLNYGVIDSEKCFMLNCSPTSSFRSGKRFIKQTPLPFAMLTQHDDECVDETPASRANKMKPSKWSHTLIPNGWKIAVVVNDEPWVAEAKYIDNCDHAVFQFARLNAAGQPSEQSPWLDTPGAAFKAVHKQVHPDEETGRHNGKLYVGCHYDNPQTRLHEHFFEQKEQICANASPALKKCMEAWLADGGLGGGPDGLVPSLSWGSTDSFGNGRSGAGQSSGSIVEDFEVVDAPARPVDASSAHTSNFPKRARSQLKAAAAAAAAPPPSLTAMESSEKYQKSLKQAKIWEPSSMPPAVVDVVNETDRFIDQMCMHGVRLEDYDASWLMDEAAVPNPSAVPMPTPPIMRGLGHGSVTRKQAASSGGLVGVPGQWKSYLPKDDKLRPTWLNLVHGLTMPDTMLLSVDMIWAISRAADLLLIKSVSEKFKGMKHVPKGLPLPRWVVSQLMEICDENRATAQGEPLVSRKSFINVLKKLEERAQHLHQDIMAKKAKKNALKDIFPFSRKCPIDARFLCEKTHALMFDPVTARIEFGDDAGHNVTVDRAWVAQQDPSYCSIVREPANLLAERVLKEEIVQMRNANFPLLEDKLDIIINARIVQNITLLSPTSALAEDAFVRLITLLPNAEKAEKCIDLASPLMIQYITPSSIAPPVMQMSANVPFSVFKSDVPGSDDDNVASLLVGMGSPAVRASTKSATPQQAPQQSYFGQGVPTRVPFNLGYAYPVSYPPPGYAAAYPGVSPAYSGGPPPGFAGGPPSGYASGPPGYSGGHPPGYTGGPPPGYTGAQPMMFAYPTMMQQQPSPTIPRSTSTQHERQL